MNKMIDPRYCQNFRMKEVCSHQNQELLDYLDNKVITPMALTFELADFDKAFEYCAVCADFEPFEQTSAVSQISH